MTTFYQVDVIENGNVNEIVGENVFCGDSVEECMEYMAEKGYTLGVDACIAVWEDDGDPICVKVITE